MKSRVLAACMGLLVSLACSVPALAQDDTPSNEELYRIIQQQQRQIEALQRQLEARDEAAQRGPAPGAQPDQETQELREIVEAQQEQIEALASAEDKPSALDKVSIGGYGELHYNNLDAEDSDNDLEQIDLHRFVLFFGYEFTKDLRFYSEVEFEHSFTSGDDDSPGAVELEQAYVQYDFNPNTSISGGQLLVPSGILNETHEPPTFYGVERNDVENIIIPTTYRVGGVQLTQRFWDGFQFDALVHEGLAIPTVGGSAFRIRSGRQNTAEANAEDLAGTVRLKYAGIPGVELGTSIQYQRDASQANDDGLEDGLLYEAHIDLQRGPFGLRALYAAWDFDIDEDIALANGVAQAQIDRAEDQNGWYIEPSYKINPQWGFYARYEDIEAARDRDTFTQWETGFNYWPHPDVVLKFDYRDRDIDVASAEGRSFKGFDLGVGYQF